MATLASDWLLQLIQCEAMSVRHARRFARFAHRSPSSRCSSPIPRARAFSWRHSCCSDGIRARVPSPSLSLILSLSLSLISEDRRRLCSKDRRIAPRHDLHARTHTLVESEHSERASECGADELKLMFQLQGSTASYTLAVQRSMLAIAQLSCVYASRQRRLRRA